ncbi:unnamed protein product [Paramecium pentaurelia]|uniref:Uncharacterized protein n=1 Tax=Paramecium pentaurelia TaxID=43138 RepID=A0A8S1XVX0_9CILI|nr:unnamed protein product [Paramecium pentaurelia]
MYDNVTTEQRPTLYRNSDQKQQYQMTTTTDSHLHHLTPMTGMKTYESPSKPYTSPEQQTMAYTTSPNNVNSFVSPIRSQILQPQLISPQKPIPSYINQSPYIRPQITSVQPIQLPIKPTIEQIHISEHPVQVIKREELDRSYQEQIQKLENQLNSLQMENIKLRSVQATEKISIGEDVTRINQLKDEIQKYMKIAFELQQEIDIWKKRYADFEAEVRFQYGVEQELSNTKRDLQETNIILNHEIKMQKDLVLEWQKKYKDLEFKIFGFNEESSVIQKTKEQQIRELQSKLALMTTEVERVNVLNNQKNNEMERWKGRFQDIETESLDKDSRLTQLNTEMSRLRQVIDNLNRENGLLKTKIINPTEFQNKINLQSQQIEQLQLKLKQSNQDYENLYQEHNQLQLQVQLNQDNKAQSYKDQIAKLELELRKVQRTFLEKDQQIKELNEKNEEMETMLQNQQSSQSKTETYVTHYVNEANQWKKKFEDQNKKYFEVQEKLALAEAELQSIKKRQQTQPIVTQTVYEVKNTSSVRTNNMNQTARIP